MNDNLYIIEAALLRIVKDLLTAMDNDMICILTLLELSAAFGTIDHQILLTRLQHSFSISGSALSWFSTYPCNRTHTVTINSLQSQHTTLHYGVSQVSVLGPVLFILYTQPLFNQVLTQSHDAKLVGYCMIFQIPTMPPRRPPTSAATSCQAGMVLMLLCPLLSALLSGSMLF